MPGAHAHTSAQLTFRVLEEELSATEPILGGLVTDAVRYAGGPVALRLIRDRVLVCEAPGPSNTRSRRRCLNSRHP
ncbi:magnesium or manganese-dependent protein phosphatase [Streptomyces albus]|uniref:Magnesium or manganese-dependent protein phosphatase n=1 Tax=Streptomyces albus (strain ATCC 21838 / DSM 41398 / FERM P-419 / JCM 4703 / NBRC 107858) TaxID=1081613 RepID=A0A0B5END4_STRA4|nr:magnesium or manganese-dependent protein phosphatase [Streptomyces albus]AOU77451.1 magnesium or manganese-dependent protein phosphatase [Streptomyces albus]AYN33224.1 hypothetical protein DUI70_2723 [Streptomyces albus]